MLKDSRLLRWREGIISHELVWFDPVNLAKPTDESQADQLETEKLEVMRSGILARRWKIPEVALARIVLTRTERARVPNAREAASGLHIIRLAFLQYGQGHAGVGEDVPGMLRYAADINHRPALSIGAIWGHRTERVAGYVERN